MVAADLSIGSLKSKQIRLAPSPPRRGLLGYLGELRSNPLRLLQRCRADYGDVVRFKLGPTTAYLLSHPEHFHRVLQKKQPMYDKDLEPLRRIRPILGNGMVTAEGAAWQQQRDTARPAFHQMEIRSFGPTISACADDLVRCWAACARERSIVDIHQEMMQITLKVAGKTLFGVDLESEAEASSDLLNATMAAGLKRMNALIALPLVVPTPNNIRLKRCRKALRQMIDWIIEERQQSSHVEMDLLSRLLLDHGDPPAAQRSEQFYDEAITLMLAGHETTANALAFALHLLGQHPSIMADLRAEAQAVLNDRPAEIDDLPALVCTRMVLDEAMRLYPPAWMIDRNAIEEDEIDGYLIAKGSLILLSPYVTHRHPDFWPDPERFEPSRFARNVAAKRPRHAYLPFGTGPRVCIGTNFALAEAIMILATLAARFDVEPVEGHVMRLDPNVTLRPKGGLPMSVRAI